MLKRTEPSAPCSSQKQEPKNKIGDEGDDEGDCLSRSLVEAIKNEPRREQGTREKKNGKNGAWPFENSNDQVCKARHVGWFLGVIRLFRVRPLGSPFLYLLIQVILKVLGYQF